MIHYKSKTTNSNFSLYLSVLFFCLFFNSSFSQEIAENAIGLRLGDNDGFGAEISYQRAIFSNNRLEFNLGWRDKRDFDAIRSVGVYQWVFPIEGNFNWFVGPGVGVGLIDVDEDRIDRNDDEVFALIAGDIGIEYHFDFPLLISLDFRPEINFNNYDDDLNFDIALGFRYQF
ncbi:hypothetical protein [Aquimarina rhabdastrellae]